MGGVLKRLVRIASIAWVAGLLAALIGAARAKRGAPPLPDRAADEVDIRAILEPLDFASTSTAFRGGHLTCWFGGGVLDLSRARMDPAGAQLGVRAVYGGAQIVVPETWDVELQVVGLLGGAGDARATRGRAVGAPRLTIEGIAIVGGIGITSERPDGRPDRNDEFEELVADA
ncbi:MAG: hypothetical protein FJ038_05895 [Chloroflexi bacterium]|nr:hypothetical protein [Chloroflexota bacterium]